MEIKAFIFCDIRELDEMLMTNLLFPKCEPRKSYVNCLERQCKIVGNVKC